MYNPTMRLLTILELLQSRAEVGGLELAQLLEVEERTIRRYILMLRDMGIPIEGERGRHGGYSLRPGFRLPPMMFNADEISAVVLGLMIMRELNFNAPLAVESATAKIERVLPSELREQTDALRNSFSVDGLSLDAYPLLREQIAAFSLAAYQRKCLQISYLAADGEITQRMIAPYGVVFHARACYVPAWCYLREELRVFRLDRVRSFAPTENPFTKPDDFDAQGYILDSLARMPGIYAFEIIFDAPLSTVQEWLPPPLGILESLGAKTLLRCYSDDPHWMARTLMNIELPFVVRETDELRLALHTLADRMRQSAG